MLILKIEMPFLNFIFEGLSLAVVMVTQYVGLQLSCNSWHSPGTEQCSRHTRTWIYIYIYVLCMDLFQGWLSMNSCGFVIFPHLVSTHSTATTPLLGIVQGPSGWRSHPRQPVRLETWDSVLETWESTVERTWENLHLDDGSLKKTELFFTDFQDEGLHQYFLGVGDTKGDRIFWKMMSDVAGSDQAGDGLGEFGESFLIGCFTITSTKGRKHWGHLSGGFGGSPKWTFTFIFTGIVGKTFHENGECESVSPMCLLEMAGGSFGKVSHGITRFGITYPTFGLMILPWLVGWCAPYPSQGYAPNCCGDAT